MWGELWTLAVFLGIFPKNTLSQHGGQTSTKRRVTRDRTRVTRVGGGRHDHLE